MHTFEAAAGLLPRRFPSFFAERYLLRHRWIFAWTNSFRHYGSGSQPEIQPKLKTSCKSPDPQRIRCPIERSWVLVAYRHPNQSLRALLEPPQWISTDKFRIKPTTTLHQPTNPIVLPAARAEHLSRSVTDTRLIAHKSIVFALHRQLSGLDLNICDHHKTDPPTCFRSALQI